MNFSKSALLDELSDRIVLIRTTAAGFSNHKESLLISKPDENQWSIAEIFEHLNISHGIYLRSIISRIDKAPDNDTDFYRSSWLGDWVYEKMLPRPDGSVFKMRAPGFLKPQESKLNIEEVFQQYFDQLEVIEKVITKAHYIDMQKIKIPFSFTTLLKLRLGDNLRFMVAHHERHLLQASRVASAYNQVH